MPKKAPGKPFTKKVPKKAPGKPITNFLKVNHLGLRGQDEKIDQSIRDHTD